MASPWIPSIHEKRCNDPKKLGYFESKSYWRKISSTSIGFIRRHFFLQSKFHTKITDQSSSNRVFVISYLGSSVTAGHTAIDTDGLCTDAFPNVIHSRLSIIFDSLGIKLLTRNAGIGNQPCVPYDICVEALAGHDVDLVHWEHSYDCLPSGTSV